MRGCLWCAYLWHFEFVDCLYIPWHKVLHGGIPVGMSFSFLKDLDDIPDEYELLLYFVHLNQILQGVSIQVNGVFHQVAYDACLHEGFIHYIYGGAISYGVIKIGVRCDYLLSLVLDAISHLLAQVVTV